MKLVYEGHAFDLEGVSAADHVVRRILETGTFYEIDLLHYLTQMGLPRGDVIDVGAQIGHAAPLGKPGGEGGEVYGVHTLRLRRGSLRG